MTADGKTNPPPESSLLIHGLLGSLLLILAVFVAYSPVWKAGYVWDDNIFVVTSPVIVGPQGIKEIWTTNAADICPLTLTTFWAGTKIWGMKPLPFHLLTVLFHALGAVVLWRVLLRLRIPGAWLGAALWALNPVQVESVAWISELKNTQSGLFFLLSILFFVKSYPAIPQRNLASWNYAWALVFAAMAMASKSSAVILPIVFCLCAWWIDRRWQWSSLIKVWPVFVMSIVTGLVSVWTQKLGGANDPHWQRSFPERLITAGDAVWFYLGKLFWPHPLIAVYPRWQVDASKGYLYLPLVAVIVILIVFWRNQSAWARPWFFVFAYFLIALLPVLGLVDLYYQRYSFVADRFQYLAAMGPLALAGAGLFWCSHLILPQLKWLPSVLGAAILLILGTLTWQRASIFQTEESLWTDTLAKNPDCWAAYVNLGTAQFDRGNINQALAFEQKALELNPGNAQAHNNLASSLRAQGKLTEAIAEYQQAIAIKPAYAEAYANLGVILVQQGQLNQGIVQFKTALEIKPYFANALYNLSVALAQKGQTDDAMVLYKKLLEINPNDSGVLNNLGLALVKKSQLDEAIAYYQKALALDPNNAEIHHNLGLAFFAQGRIDDAGAQFQKAVDLNPGYAEAHNNLGVAFAQKGQLPQAIAHFQEALRLKPGYADAINNLAKTGAKPPPHAQK